MASRLSREVPDEQAAVTTVHRESAAYASRWAVTATNHLGRRSRRCFTWNTRLSKECAAHAGLRPVSRPGLLSATLEIEADPTLDNESTGSCCLVCRVLGLDAGQGVDPRLRSR